MAPPWRGHCFPTPDHNGGKLQSNQRRGPLLIGCIRSDGLPIFAGFGRLHSRLLALQAEPVQQRFEFHGLAGQFLRGRRAFLGGCRVGLGDLINLLEAFVDLLEGR